MWFNDPLYCWVILIARIYCYKLSEIVRHSQLQIQKTSQMLPKLSLRIRSWTNNNKNLSTMSPASRVEFSLKTLSFHPEEFRAFPKNAVVFILHFPMNAGLPILSLLWTTLESHSICYLCNVSPCELSPKWCRILK